MKAKLLPCPRCGTAKTLDGKPYWAGRWPGREGAYLYRCEGCKRPCGILPAEFHKLPTQEVTP